LILEQATMILGGQADAMPQPQLAFQQAERGA